MALFAFTPSEGADATFKTMARSKDDGALGETQAFTLAQNALRSGARSDEAAHSTEAAAMLLAEFDIEGARARARALGARHRAPLD